MKAIWESPPRHRFGPVVVVNLHLQKRSHHVSCLGCFMAWGRGVCNMLHWLLQPIATARNRLPWIAGVIFSWLACFNFVPPTPTEQQTCIFFPHCFLTCPLSLKIQTDCRLPWNVLTTNCFKLHFFSFFFSVVTAWTSIPLSWLWCGVPVCVSVKVTIRLELEQDTPLMENLIHQTLFFNARLQWSSFTCLSIQKANLQNSRFSRLFTASLSFANALLGLPHACQEAMPGHINTLHCVYLFVAPAAFSGIIYLVVRQKYFVGYMGQTSQR